MKFTYNYEIYLFLLNLLIIMKFTFFLSNLLIIMKSTYNYEIYIFLLNLLIFIKSSHTYHRKEIYLKRLQIYVTLTVNIIYFYY